MGNKKIISLFLLICLLLITLPLNAQTAGSANRIVRDQEGFNISQVIYLPLLENILRYEIEIEVIHNDTWIQVQKLETPKNSFEVSLPAGNYRYRYTAYNRMNLAEGISNWQNFELLPAILPDVTGYRPYYGLFYDMPDPDGVLIIYSTDFFDKTEFALIRSNINTDWTGVSLEASRDIIFPVNVEVNEDSARLIFPPGSVRKGNYRIFIRNPGGVWVSYGEVRAGFLSNHDIIFGSGWAPWIGSEYNNNGIDANIGYFNIVWFPFKTSIGNFGIFFNIFTRGFSLNIQYGNFGIHYQLPFSDRWQHNIRIGANPFLWADEYYYDENLGEWVYGERGYFWNYSLGYSVQYFIWKNFYAQAGIEFIYENNTVHNKNNFYIFPSLGVGFQLGRWGERAEVAEGRARGEDYSVPVTETPKPEHIFSFGWSPMIPLSGYDLYAVKYEYQYPNAYLGQGSQFLNYFNPLSLNLRYAYLPHRLRNNTFGFNLELTILAHRNSGLLIEDYFWYIFDLIHSLFIGVQYQYELNENFSINAGASIGFANTYSYEEMFFYDYYIGELVLDNIYTRGMDFAVKFGVSLQYFLNNNFFAQASADIQITPGGNSGITLVQFRPGISIGWQFNRRAETGINLPGSGFPFESGSSSQPRASEIVASGRFEGNGNYYEVIDLSMTWEEAREEAE